ncbi:MAG TPA: WD40 repeat domain-containing protein [Urbifossiella sp.]|jgi:WD40 repeat protein|nr:WD40 repeat domain-containing protein [Urbifossiella sp.]
MARSPENKFRPGWSASVPDHVVGLSWSPDGRFLAAAAVSGPVAVFDAAGKIVHTLAGHGFGTSAVAWQPAGTLLATAGQDGTVRLWDATTGAEAHVLDAGAAWVEKLAWHPDGRLVAAAAGKAARVWDAAGNPVLTTPAQAGTVTDLGWRPGTSQLAVLGYGAANVYDAAAGGAVVHLFAWKGSPLALAWSPDGKILAHGNQDATVHFWYAATGTDLQMWGYPSKVRELSWDCTGRFLATGGGPMVCVWDCGGPKGPEGTQPQMLEGPEDTVTAVGCQRRGYLVAATARDGRVILWQPANKKAPKVGEYRFKDAEAAALAWSPDDKALAAGAGDGTVAVLRVG